MTLAQNLRVGQLAAVWVPDEAHEALRGVSMLNAAPPTPTTIVVAEIGCFGRFDNPRQLMGYLDLVPSEHSSGRTVRRGPITKTDNNLAHPSLIEAAWTYRFPPRPQTVRPSAGAYQGSRLEGANPAQSPRSPSDRRRQGDHGDRQRTGRLHLGDRPHGRAEDGLILLARHNKGDAIDPSFHRCAWLAAGRQVRSPLVCGFEAGPWTDAHALGRGSSTTNLGKAVPIRG